MMSRIHRLSIPMMLAALVAVLIGPSMVTATAAASVTERVMIPAAAFIPTTDGWDYNNNGYYLDMSSGSGNFAAPLTFPAQQVRMTRITLYAWDNGTGQACATLYRAEPTEADESNQGQVCTTDSSADPQKVSTGTQFPRFANTGMQMPYLWVSLSGDATLYGVAVTYTYTP
jgi:hypothetical protein